MDDETTLRWGTRTMQHVDGVVVHVERAGTGPGPVIAALHGFASGTFSWAGVAPGWASEHPVVAWDRPPFGRSDRPRPIRGPDDPYGLPAELGRAVAVVEPVVDGAEDARVVLVGHSAGALSALHLTLAHRFPVAGLVLIAPALAGEPPAAVRRVAGLPGLDRLGGAALGVALRGARPALRAMSRHPSPLIEATAAETARCLRRPGTARALWHLTSTWQPPTILDDLAPLGLPTLVIGGRDDRISPPDPTQAVADALGAELHLLDHVGHAPHEQVPEVVGPLVRAFVSRMR